VPNTLGEAVLALHAQGLGIDRETLLAHLLEQADGRGPNDLRRLVAEAAASSLGWSPPPTP
jgi:heme oxygenase